jgi:twitching motility protein PilT
MNNTTEENPQDIKTYSSPSPAQQAAQQEARVLALDDVMALALQTKASDVHITANYRPMLRVNGVLQQLKYREIYPEEAMNFAKQILANKKGIDYDNFYQFDTTYVLQNRRFRVNIFKQGGNFSIAARVISDQIPQLDILGLPPVVKDFSRFPNGLVLVTGPTGSGKSTTLASLINLINITESKHVITLEDPIEYIFPKGQSLIEQREYLSDFESWSNALKAVLRQDPNIVLVGEMRDSDTIESAIRIAETGHLVFATLHTNSAAQSIDRIVDVFPGEKQDQIKVQLASVLQAVVSQKLVKTVQGGQKLATEVLLANSAVRNTIREGKGYQLDNVIQTSNDLGMQSLEKSLVNLVKQGHITVDTAKSNANKPADVDSLLNRS